MTEEQIDEINMQYLPRLTVENADAYIDKSTERSALVRKQLACEIDVRYGNTPGQMLDIFPAARAGAPVHVFIHGGYWRSLDKNIYSHIAVPLVAAGATVVLVNYDLCPTVRITEIVQQVRRSIVWMYENIARYRGDPKKLYVSGHSAGGHITGMIISTDWQKEVALPNDIIKGTVPLSGLFDVEPHRHSQLQPDIRLTAEEALDMSPMYLPPVAKGPSILAVGGKEPHLFHWQSLEYAARLRLHGVRAEYVSLSGDNHFEVTDRLGDANDPLTKAVIAQMGL